MKTESKTSLSFGLLFLSVAFVIFFLYGNAAIGTVLLALGIIFVVNGGRERASGKTATE